MNPAASGTAASSSRRRRRPSLNSMTRRGRSSCGKSISTKGAVAGQVAGWIRGVVWTSRRGCTASGGWIGGGFWDAYAYCIHTVYKKRARLQFLGAGHIPGNDLLSQDLSSQYHRRCGVSLPGSERDRVVPPRSGHQSATLFRHMSECRGCISGDIELCKKRQHEEDLNSTRTLTSIWR